MLLGEKVEKLMSLRGWNLAQCAREVTRAGPIAVKYQNIQQLIADPGMHPRYIVQLAKAFGFTVEQLEQWEPGDPLPTTSQHVGEEPPAPYLRSIVVWNDPADLPPDQHVFLRRLDIGLCAGARGPQPDDAAEYEVGAAFRADYAARKGWRRETHFTMRADGESMEPTIQNNAPVVIATNECEVRSGKIYALQLNPDEQPILKRVDKLPGNRLRIRSDNPAPAFAPFEVAADEVEIIGRAVWTPSEL